MCKFFFLSNRYCCCRLLKPKKKISEKSRRHTQREHSNGINGIHTNIHLHLHGGISNDFRCYAISYNRYKTISRRKQCITRYSKVIACFGNAAAAAVVDGGGGDGGWYCCWIWLLHILTSCECVRFLFSHYLPTTILICRLCLFHCKIYVCRIFAINNGKDTPRASRCSGWKDGMFVKGKNQTATTTTKAGQLPILVGGFAKCFDK